MPTEENELEVLSTEPLNLKTVPTEKEKKKFSFRDWLNEVYGLLRIRMKRRKFQTTYMAFTLIAIAFVPWLKIGLSLPATSKPLNEAVWLWYAFLSITLFSIGFILILQFCFYPMFVGSLMTLLFYACDLAYNGLRFIHPKYVLTSAFGEVNSNFFNESALCGEELKVVCRDYYTFIFFLEAVKSLFKLIIAVILTGAVAFVSMYYVKSQKSSEPMPLETSMKIKVVPLAQIPEETDSRLEEVVVEMAVHHRLIHHLGPVPADMTHTVVVVDDEIRPIDE